MRISPSTTQRRVLVVLSAHSARPRSQRGSSRTGSAAEAGRAAAGRTLAAGGSDTGSTTDGGPPDDADSPVRKPRPHAANPIAISRPPASPSPIALRRPRCAMPTTLRSLGSTLCPVYVRRDRPGCIGAGRPGMQPRRSGQAYRRYEGGQPDLPGRAVPGVRDPEPTRAAAYGDAVVVGQPASRRGSRPDRPDTGVPRVAPD